MIWTLFGSGIIWACIGHDLVMLGYDLILIWKYLGYVSDMPLGCVGHALGICSKFAGHKLGHVSDMF